MASLTEQYMLDYFDSLRRLKAKQNEFEDAASDPGSTDGARASAAAAYLDMANMIARLREAHEAFMHRFGPVSTESPTQKIVDESSRLHKELGEIIAKSQGQVALMHALSDFVDRWQKLSTDSKKGATKGKTAAAANLNFLTQPI
ncbi:hypothetical protein [Pseudoduganella sp. R-43]|uniref:hypothetical protein n=1 Tax=unclassified Pseudoduganella TaxID=2637179 RepID=UPI003CF8F7B0